MAESPTYANVAQIRTGTEEVLIEFAIQTGPKEKQIVASVILHPAHAQRLGRLLVAQPDQVAGAPWAPPAS